MQNSLFPLMMKLLLIGVYLLAGVLGRKLKLLPEQTHRWLNAAIINICLPALAILHLPKLKFEVGLWMPVATAWLVFAGAMVFFKLLQGMLKFDNLTLGCLTLTCGLFNSAFIGLPVINALFGEEGLRLAILVDQAGSFLVLSTLGTLVGFHYSTGSLNLMVVAKKVLTFPPFIGFVVGGALLLLQIEVAPFVAAVLGIFAKALTPIALISLGLQLDLKFMDVDGKVVGFGLAYKLILAPLAIFMLFGVALKNESLAMKVSVMQAAMAPMISGGILANTLGLNPKLSNAIIGLGIPLSFITLAVWYWVVV